MADTGTQWFQSSETVTATLKLQRGGLQGDITANFQESRCSVYIGGITVCTHCGGIIYSSYLTS